MRTLIDQTIDNAGHIVIDVIDSGVLLISIGVVPFFLQGTVYQFEIIFIKNKSPIDVGVGIDPAAFGFDFGQQGLFGVEGV